MTEWIILTIPFAGTALGAAMVFLLKNGLGSRVKKLLLGFASAFPLPHSQYPDQTACLPIRCFR